MKRIIALVALQAADIATTWYALKYGLGYEGNPFMSNLTTHYLWAVAVMKGAWIVLFVYGTQLLGGRLAIVLWSAALLISSAVVANNLLVILRIV